jgi:hypothetical protein
MSAGVTLMFASGAPPEQVLVETASGLVFLAYVLVALFSSVASLSALCAVVPALLPGRVVSAARVGIEHPLRSTLLGAINVAGGLLLAAVLARNGPPFALLGLAVCIVLGYFALVGLAGLGGAVARTLLPGREIGPLHAAAGGGLLALGCFFPVLGQIFGLLCLCCAVGSAVSSVRERL